MFSTVPLAGCFRDKAVQPDFLKYKTPDLEMVLVLRKLTLMFC